MSGGSFNGGSRGAGARSNAGSGGGDISGSAISSGSIISDATGEVYFDDGDSGINIMSSSTATSTTTSPPSSFVSHSSDVGASFLMKLQYSESSNLG